MLNILTFQAAGPAAQPAPFVVSPQLGYIANLSSYQGTQAIGNYSSFTVTNFMGNFTNSFTFTPTNVFVQVYTDAMVGIYSDSTQMQFTGYCSINNPNNPSATYSNHLDVSVKGLQLYGDMGIMMASNGINVFNLTYTPPNNTAKPAINASCNYTPVNMQNASFSTNTTFQFVMGSDNIPYAVFMEKGLLTVMDVTNTNRIGFLNVTNADSIIEPQTQQLSNYLAYRNTNLTNISYCTLNMTNTTINLGTITNIYLVSSANGSVYTTLGLQNNFLNVTQLLQYNRTSLFGEDYLIFWSIYGFSELLFYRLQDGRNWTEAVTNYPFNLYGDGLNTLYLFGSFGSLNSFYSTVNMNDIITPSNASAQFNTNNSCWANVSFWNVTVMYNIMTGIQVTVGLNSTTSFANNKTQCSQSNQLNLTFQTFQGLTSLNFTPATNGTNSTPGQNASYTGIIACNITQPTYDIIVQQQRGLDPNGFWTSFVYSSGFVSGLMPCYWASYFNISVQNNQMNFVPTFTQNCAVDAPQIMATVTQNGQTAKQNMTQISPLTPFNSPLYFGYFAPNTSFTFQGSETATVTITETSPQGFNVGVKNVTMPFNAQAMSCFQIPNTYLSWQYLGDHYQLALANATNKFQPPCNPTPAFLDLQINWTVNGVNQTVFMQQFQNSSNVQNLSFYSTVPQNANISATSIYAANLSVGQLIAVNFTVNNSYQPLPACFTNPMNLLAVQNGSGVQLTINQYYNCTNAANCTNMQMNCTLPGRCTCMMGAQNISLINSNNQSCPFTFNNGSTYYSSCNLSFLGNVTMFYNISYNASTNKTVSMSESLMVIDMRTYSSYWLPIVCIVWGCVIAVYLVLAILYIVFVVKDKKGRPKVKASLDETEPILTEYVEDKTAEIDQVKEEEQEVAEVEDPMNAIPKPKVKK